MAFQAFTNNINALAPKKKPAVTPAPSSSGGGGGGFGFMFSRVAKKLKQAVKPPAPAAAPAAPAAPAPFTPGTLDTRAATKLHEIALSDAESPWAAMAREKQQTEETSALDNLRAGATGQTKEAMDTLAMRGGLSGGAAANIASRGAENEIMQSQALKAQGMQARQGIGLQDYQTKMGILGNLPGISTNIYSEQQKAIGAKALADAIANGGGGGTVNGIKGGVNAPFTAANSLVPGSGDYWKQLAQLNTTVNPLGPAGSFVHNIPGFG